jgi:cyanate permease
VRARHHRGPSRPFESDCRFVGLALYASLGLLPPGTESYITNGGTGVSAALLGFSAGAEVDILSFLVARYFGLRSYGAIYGSELVFFAAGSGVGGILTGYVRDISGSYQPALIGGIFVFSLAALIILLLGRSPRVSLASGVGDQTF